MLFLLRKIRRKLMEKNKFTTYLLYAIGEIFLVVIGILIAVSINNWNNDRKEQKEITDQLTALLEDLKEDKKNLASSRNYHSFRYYSGQLILKLLGEKPVEQPRDNVEYDEIVSEIFPLWGKPIPDHYDTAFVHFALTWIDRWVPFIPNKEVIEEMNKGGRLLKLKNAKVKESLDTYYEEVEWRFVSDRKAYGDDPDYFSLSLVEEGILLLNIHQIEDPLSVFYERSDRVGYLKLSVGEGFWYASSATHCLAVLDQTIDELELEIANRH